MVGGHGRLYYLVVDDEYCREIFLDVPNDMRKLRCVFSFSVVSPLSALTFAHLGFALTLVWVSNTVPRPPAKRSAAIALVNGFGNIANLYVVMQSSSECTFFSRSLIQQHGILHLEIELGPRVSSIDDYCALCARAYEYPQFWCVYGPNSRCSTYGLTDSSIFALSHPRVAREGE